MHHIHPRFFFLLLSACAFPVTAGDEASQRLQTLLTGIASYHSPFSQTLYNEKGEILQSTKGTFYLKKPAQFRWETFSPFKQILISNGKTFWNYEVELEQVTIEPTERILQETPIAVLSYGGHIEDYFDIKPSAAHAEWFQLFPKQKKSKELFDHIELQFINKGIREMKIIDKLGQNSHIIFYDPKMNLPLLDTTFRLEIPKGVDVVTNPH
ncbi:MAG: outer membrane lipoprotein chaperone LolA [Gammaproteobacteria bacterium]|nr:outer membrane lipoprotein chaperone LolA [Gammaproteobacteria bacterium]